jgi:capsular exopolysaccharide synthesis family protein
MTDIVNRGNRLPRQHDMRDVALATEPDVVQYVPLEAAAPAAVDEQTIGDVLLQLWRRRWLLLVASLTGTAIAAIVCWSLPTLYTAEARVIVGLQGPKVLNNVDATIQEINPDAERVSNESFILQSRTIARQVIDQLNLAENPAFAPPPPSLASRLLDDAKRTLLGILPDWLATGVDEPRAEPSAQQRTDRLIDLLLSRLDVTTLGRSHVLSVKADAPDAATAAAIANTFAEKYLAHQRQDKIATMNRVDKFLLERIEELREEVRKADQAVQDYRRQHGIYKSNNNSNVAAQQLSELNTQLLLAQTAKAEALSRLDEAKRLSRGGMGADTVPQVLQSPVVVTLKQQLADAERKAAEKSASYGERHEMLRNARAEVGAISARLNAEIGRTIESLEREARATSARYDAVLADFERVKAQMGQVNEKSIELDALERDATVHRNLLEAVLQRAKQTMGSAQVVQSGGKIVSLAAVPENAGFPPTLLLLFLGMAGGLAVGAGVAVALEGNDRTFRRPDQIEQMTGAPVLAVVPQVRSRTAAQEVVRTPLSPYSEALRRLSVGVEFSQPLASPKTLLISSAVPGEGKSVTAASLGRQLARNGKRVLLIDCDLRSPRLHQIFRSGNSKGLADLLAGRAVSLEECVRTDGLSGLDFVPAGLWEPQLLHLLVSDRMGELLQAFSAHYDLVILDTSPVLATADAIALSRFVEKTVFVVRWGHTRQDAVLAALKQLVDVQADIAGIVLSRVVPKDFRRHALRELSYGRAITASFRA